MSPSSQRVWIEIFAKLYDDLASMSPSSQRVWIEIIKSRLCNNVDNSRPLHRGCGLKLKNDMYTPTGVDVALFTEGVDWNRKFV